MRQVHCVDPVSGDTLHVSTGLPILLTNLAVLPRLAVPRRRPRAGLSGGETRLSSAGETHVGFGRGSDQSEADNAAASSDSVDGDDAEEVVIAVGGVGGRVTLVGLEVSLDEAATLL